MTIPAEHIQLNEPHRPLPHLHTIKLIASPDIADSYYSVLTHLDQFASIITNGFVNGLSKFAQEEIALKGSSMAPVFQYVKDKDLDKPTFMVMGQPAAKDFLTAHYLPALENDEILMTFQLPKPLATFWHKGVYKWGEKGVDTRNMVIEWGVFYRKLLPKVWHKLQHENTVGHFISRRINMVGEHDSKDYYYAWGIKKTSPLFNFTDGADQEERTFDPGPIIGDTL